MCIYVYPCVYLNELYLLFNTFAAIVKPSRTFTSMPSKKHFKCKVVDNVAVITLDSPGTKVQYYILCFFL